MGKRDIIWILLAAPVGACLALIGYPLTTWQFWAVYVPALAWSAYGYPTTANPEGGE